MRDDVERARRRRVAGLLVGIALAEDWGRSTELALCVADAAATGLPLDDERAVDLLRRNLRSRHLETENPDALDDDAVRAACAVVAAAHHADDEPERDSALTAVLDTLAVARHAREGLPAWSRSVAEIIATGSVDRTSSEHGETPFMEIIHATMTRMRRAAFAPAAEASRLLAFDLPELRIAPAATGAIVGALFGVHALPPTTVAGLTGWPDADADALVRLADDVAAPRERGLPGMSLALSDPPVPAPPREPGSPSRAWQVEHVTLTPKETMGR